MTEVLGVEQVGSPDVNGNSGDVTEAVLQAAYVEEQALLAAGGKKPTRTVIVSPGDTMGPLE